MKSKSTQVKYVYYSNIFCQKYHFILKEKISIKEKISFESLLFYLIFFQKFLNW